MIIYMIIMMIMMMTMNNDIDVVKMCMITGLILLMRAITSI